MSYWSFDQQVSEDDALHYGRLGMKWGQHIYGTDQVRSKANKKLTKLDANVKKSESKVGPKLEKAFTRQAKAQRAILFKGIKNWRASGATNRAAKSIANVQAKKLKAKKWAEAMEKHFKKIGVNTFSDDVAEIGQNYINMTLDDIAASNVSINAILATSDRYRTKLNR